MSRTVRQIWGWVLVVVGAIGLIVPIMPGWIFLIPGLVILSDRFVWARRLLDWVKKRKYGRYFDRNKGRGEGSGDQ
ncbi:MAG TPA: PGPGW domain-containing protein [Bryobacteraceae bacterium]|nr:PGPGW domain-containing protein [Bryobacteraceae bacterium]